MLAFSFRSSHTYPEANASPGGMPSPKCRILISLIALKWFVPVSGEGGLAFIESSITPGTTMTLKSSLKVLIRQYKDLQPQGTHFLRSENLAIKATMQWLNRTLPCLGYTRTIDLQNPIELRHFNHLSTTAQGSRSRFSYEILVVTPMEQRNILLIYYKIFNISAKALGNSSNYGRQVKLYVTFPAEFGSLQSTEEMKKTNLRYLNGFPNKRQIRNVIKNVASPGKSLSRKVRRSLESLRLMKRTLLRMPNNPLDLFQKRTFSKLRQPEHIRNLW